MTTEKIIKSKQRVKAFAEVFTPSPIVKKMLDLLDKGNYSPKTTFFDPSCGNGNFLAEILRRKLAKVREEYDGNEPAEWLIYDCASSVYGVDIQLDNVEECRQRLFDICYRELTGILGVNPVPFVSVLQNVFKQNIVLGDTLKGEFFLYSHQREGEKLKVAIYRFSDALEIPGGGVPILIYTTLLPKVFDFYPNDTLEEEGL
nr:MAG TPA: N-6 DNA Methylase [Caudoviricetes sp.]